MNILLNSLIIMVLFFDIGYALGTPSGTSISNQAILSYTSDGIDYNRTSNQVNDVVDQLIDLKLEWLDMNPILVEGGDKGVALTFRLVNIGNGDDVFLLTHTHDANSSFEAQNIQTYKDSNENGVYDSSDEPIDSINLVADEVATLFLVSDIPNLNSSQSAKAYEKLQARSSIGGSGIVGDATKIGIIDGFKGGVDVAIGGYEILGYRLNSNKSAVVQNQFGSDIPIRGAIVTYSIDLSMDGIGEVKNIVINDAIPKGTLYQGGSLTLDGTALSDGIDSDVGSFNGSAIQVQIASMKQTETVIPKHKISFRVEIK